MSHETFKQSDDGTHRNVSVIPPTTGREMEQGFQLCSEIHCYTMLRLFLGVPWAVPSQSLSAYEILRQAHSWRHLLPLESNFGLRTAHWLFLHSILESVYFLPFFSPSVRVISHNFTVIWQLSQPFPTSSWFSFTSISSNKSLHIQSHLHLLLRSRTKW